MNTKELKVTREVAIVLPSRPNFIKVGESQVDIKDIDDGTLKKIADAWTGALLAEAAERRNTPIPRSGS